MSKKIYLYKILEISIKMKFFNLLLKKNNE